MSIDFLPFQEEHLSLLKKWLKETHVSEFWQETEDEKEFREKFLNSLSERGVSPFIIVLDAKPIGYIQHYEARKVGGGWWAEAKEGTFGIDQFIGEPAFIGRGIGTEVIKRFLDRLFLNPSVEEVITDPDPGNGRAIRAYEKAGFEAVKEIKTPGGRALLMQVTRSKRLSMQVEECVIASAWVKPESKVYDSPEIYKLVNTSAPYEFMNGVYRTRLASGHTDNEIAVHYQFFKENKISFRWYVFPHSRPDDLDERIQRLNPARVTEMQGLYANADDSGFQVPAGVTVEELSEKNLEEYADTNIAGWSQTGEEAEKIRREIRADFEKGNMGYQGFLARHDGRPASTGLLRIVGGVGYFYGGSTRPEFRGKGAYRGLVAHRLKLLGERGIPRAFVLARKATSAPICRKLGFQVACECRSYDFSF